MQTEENMLPLAFLERMEQLLGEEYGSFLESFEQEKYQALRLNPLKRHIGGKTACELIEEESGESRLPGLPFSLRQVPWAGHGYYYGREEQPGKHPWHDGGVYYIQEPSAMAPVGLLEPRPGERILDLCAAPGGKSTQIAGATEGKGFLVCNEIHPARAKILSENIERMGIRNACVTNETPARLAEIFGDFFDRILVDAPCSGEGMFRKNEAACEEWSPENVEICAARQDEILDCAAGMLRPGGRLVYSTCTFAPAENEGSISRFLTRHKDFEILPIERTEFPGSVGRPDWVTEPAAGLENTLRLWPQHIRGEGHFAAVLERKGTVPEDYRPLPSGGTLKVLGKKELAEVCAFVEENLKKEGAEGETGSNTETVAEAFFRGNCIGFGDNIYLVPDELPGLKGMKVMRPGLHLGTIKKNRFEPSHALALALAPGETKRVWNLTIEEASAYLNGLTFPAEGEKGWYLICADGFGIGWGKLAGGIMKNHYPKGLRKP